MNESKVLHIRFNARDRATADWLAKRFQTDISDIVRQLIRETAAREVACPPQVDTLGGSR